MFPTIDIYDFDNTVTVAHTGKHPDQFQPESNTKSNLPGLFVHNDKKLSAIATFHSKPEYVLTYLLPLLGLTEEDIVNRETVQGEHHQLLKVFLKNSNYPLIIATPRLDNLNVHLRALFQNGKNDLLKAISEELPACYEYHFHDDQVVNYRKAHTYMRHFYCHLVNGDSDEFVSLETTKPDSTAALKVVLKAYLAQVDENQQVDESQKRFTSLNALSLFAESTSAATSSSSALTKSTVAGAIMEVIDFLDYNSSGVNKETIEFLTTGEAQAAISYWEEQSGEQLAPFILAIVKQREEAAKFVVTYEEDDDEGCNYGY